MNKLNFLPIVLGLILGAFILLIKQFLPTRLPLFYSLPWGESQLATTDQLFVVPAIIIAISLVNLTVFWQLHPSQILFKNILTGVSLFCSLVLTISVMKIIFIFI